MQERKLTMKERLTLVLMMLTYRAQFPLILIGLVLIAVYVYAVCQDTAYAGVTWPIPVCGFGALSLGIVLWLYERHEDKSIAKDLKRLEDELKK